MNTIYILLIIVITLVTNASLSFAMPFMKAKYNAFISRIKRKLNAPKPVIDATTYFELLSRIEELEQKSKKRQINFKSRVREEVIEYLEQLKNK